MKASRTLSCLLASIVLACLLALPALAEPGVSTGPGLRSPHDDPPTETVKLIFVHHSCGANWLADGNGGLGIALRDNNYFVSDTYYGWSGGGVGIGDRTDIGHWWEWFLGPNRDGILADLYAESDQANANYARGTDPGGSNEIIMFKSCYPNSNLQGGAVDPPTVGSNPLEGQAWNSPHHTVANAKAIYRDLLVYFGQHTEKMFVVITAPPVQSDTYSLQARHFNRWLVNDWLDDYPYYNVMVWDFYNVLTSNGGSWNVNDLGAETGNHHRFVDGKIWHIYTQGGNTAAYPTGGSDDHPSPAGNQKATGEFVPLLNVYYNIWREYAHITPEPTRTATASPTPTETPLASATPTVTRTPTVMRTTQPSATGTPTPTTEPGGQRIAVFQRGRLPNPAYDSAPDTILSKDEPDANLGGLDHLEVFFGENEIRRSLLLFDLGQLEALGDVRIEGATLQLWRYDGDAENDQLVMLYRLTRDWVEGTGENFWPGAGYVPDGATWNNATTYEAWSRAGGEIDLSSDYGDPYVGVVGRTWIDQSVTTGLVSIDATGAVRDWVENDVPNYGMALTPNSGRTTYHYFRSGNWTVPAQRPRLVVTYTLGSAPEMPVTVLLPLILRR